MSITWCYIHYNDGLCAFRACACHNSGDDSNLERTTKMYYAQWITKYRRKGSFPRITINDLPRFEELFQINDRIFSLNENGTETAFHHPPCLFDATMHINIYNNNESMYEREQIDKEHAGCQPCKETQGNII